LNDVLIVLAEGHQPHAAAAARHVGKRRDHHVARACAEPVRLILHLFDHHAHVAHTEAVQHVVHAAQAVGEVRDIALGRGLRAAGRGLRLNGWCFRGRAAGAQ